MGGDDSLKLQPWRGAYSSLGRNTPADCKLNTLTQGHLLPSPASLGHSNRGLQPVRIASRRV